MDWKDTSYTGRLRAYMIPPTNLDDEYGELLGIDWAASSVSCGYYKDARHNASITYVGDGWIRGSFIRLVYEIPEANYRREIGTYAVGNDDATRANGTWSTSLELNSMLYTLSLDIPASPRVIEQGASALSAITAELQAAGRDFIIKDANDYFFNSAKIYESGDSRLSRLFDLCNISDNRLEEDSHGRIIVSRYVNPASKTPSFTIDLEDARGIAKDGISRSTNFFATPSVAVVTYKYTENDENGESVEREITASCEVSAADHGSMIRRGYTVTDFTSLSDMEPATYEEAYRRASEKLEAKSQEKVEWKVESKYLPIWEGDVVELIIPDGFAEYRGARHCLVKSADFSPPFMDVSLTLKETSSGDDDE